MWGCPSARCSSAKKPAPRRHLSSDSILGDLERAAQQEREVSTRPKVAVAGLSFGIRRAECFGFLGLNGAGKTTSMKMLTGDLSASSGRATLTPNSPHTRRGSSSRRTKGEIDLVRNQAKARSEYGYCPQFDALIPLMTVRETLAMYARIKYGEGRNGSKGGKSQSSAACIEEQVLRSIERLDLKKHEHTLAGALSGGNKRKLSVAIALLGSPSLLFLDEPSTGMDPVARRFMWRVLADYSSAGGAIMLTTHSMEECEALCQRVGILAAGQLICLGSISHLKAVFGKELMLEITLNALSDDLRSCNDLLDAMTQKLEKAGVCDGLCYIPEERLALACECLGEADRMQRISAQDPSGWLIWQQLQRDSYITATELCKWWLDDDRKEGLCSFITERFGQTAHLVEQFGSRFTFKVAAKRMSLGTAFSTIESHKEQLQICEYSISQTTLEQIFTDFAQQ